MVVCYLSDIRLPSKAANTIQIVNFCDSLGCSGNMVYLLVSGISEEEKNINRFYGVEGSFSLVNLKCFSLPKKSYLCSVKSLKILKSISPDLVYGRYVKGCCIALIAGCRTALELHHPPNITKSLLDKMVFRILKKHLFLVAASYSLKHYVLKKLNIREDRFFVLLNGSKTSNSVNGGFQNALSVGYTGSLYKIKGSDILMGLRDFVLGNFNRVDFKLIGKGAEGVEFVPYSKVKDFVKQLDICLLPMKGNYSDGSEELKFFGIPLKLMDYMSVGGTIIASDNPLVREVLSDKKGVLVEQDNVDRWKQIVGRLLFLPKLRKRYKLQLLKEFPEKYSWERRAQLFVEKFSRFTAH